MASSSPAGVTCHAGRDRDWHGAILTACPSLRSGYTPTPWARNPHVQNLLTLVHERRTPALSWELDERLAMPDGGTVSVQWLGLDAPANAPVLVLLHTLCGSGDALRRLIRSLRVALASTHDRTSAHDPAATHDRPASPDRPATHDRAAAPDPSRADASPWVIAACNRRGHADLPLTAPVVNTMGSTGDLRRQLAAIERRRPGAPIYAVGVSAGSGLLVRYLGEERAASRVRAAVALCPAYDVREAFDFTHPRYDAYLTRRLVDFFLVRNRAVLGAVAGFDACAASSSMTEFHDRLFPLAGYDSRESYYRASNPMEVALDVATPMLVINAADDPVCVERNVHNHLPSLERLPRMTLALTRRGGHCGFFEGPLAERSWADRAVAEYLQAAHAMLADA